MGIEIDHLTKRFGDATVLDDISFEVGDGEIFAIVGPSGAGKSTLSRCIGFLERPTSGSVRIDGRDFTQLDSSELIDARRRIGTIFQTAPLLRRRTVAQNVALPLAYLGATKRSLDARVTDLLEHVGLASRRDYYPAQLSGGQKQRVGIARALALGPSTLLSDEATSGLDPATTKSILALLSGLRDEFGLSIVLITHEMDVVREIADSVARIEGGRLIEQGSVRDVLLDPASSLAHELLPDRPAVEAAPGSEVWEISYASASVDLAWLSTLDTRVDVLSASVESVRGVAVGRVALGFAREAPPGFRESLASRGLHVRTVRTVEAVAA